MTCSITDCDNSTFQANLCYMHYTLRRKGLLLEVPCSVPGCTSLAMRLRPDLCRPHLAAERSLDGFCRIDGCSNTASRRGMCTAHYYRMYERGRLDLLPTRSPEERFWAMVTKTDECWLWTGNTDKRGYGKFEIQRRSYDETIPAERVMAHRYAYTLLIGPIPDGHELDHVCEVKNCVRPEHLDPVTRTEHGRRTSLRQTHCKRGHEFSTANTRVYKNMRHCRECERIRNRERRARLRAERE